LASRSQAGPAVPVAVGPEVAPDPRLTKSVSSEVTSDFYFAIRLTKIKYNKKREIVYETYKEGALFSVGRKQTPPQSDGEAAADEVEVW